MGLILSIFAYLLTGCGKSETQHSHAPRKIAVLQFGTHPVIDSVVRGFETRIESLYGDSVAITKYNGNFDMNTVSVLSKQIVASDADVIVSITTSATAQLIGANRGARPLVFTFVSDPAAIGYKAQGSLKNTTGLSDQVDYVRTLQLVRQFMPRAKSIGYLITRSEANALVIHKGFMNAAPQQGFEIKTAAIASQTDLRIAAQTLAPDVDLFLFGGDNSIAGSIGVLLNAARARKIPVFACDELSVERGALAAYSVDYNHMGQKTADVCGLVLGGADPAKIPVEIFTGTRLVVNEEASKETGVMIPRSIAESADRIVK